MGKFIYKGRTELKEGAELQEADYSTIIGNELWQWEYKEEEGSDSVVVSPGIYSLVVKDHALNLKPSSFNINKNIMEDYIHTKTLTEKIDNFFSKLSIYDKYGIFPKRGILMYGSQGTGKSLMISMTSRKYVEAGDTAVIYWPTDKFRASDVKYFLKDLKYSDKCKKLILVVEDIGGVSVDGAGQKLSVEPSLLSILDNVESVFKIPTMILATTNFPQNLLQNIANRPKRFDYLHEVGNPTAEQRSKFLEFFSQGKATKAELEQIKDRKYKEFSVAHMEEIVIRAELEEVSIGDSIDQVLAQSNLAVNDFAEPTRGMGII